MKRKILCLICGVLALALAGCSASSEPQIMDPTVLVETTTVHTDTLSANSTYIGTISAEGTANVVAMVSGTVKELAVSTGDTVSAGDLALPLRR